MSEHERTIDLNVSPQEAYDFLSSLDSLPRFLPHIREIRPEEDDHIFALAKIDGRRYEMSGYFRATPSERRVEWGSDGTPDYAGWLKVDDGRDRNSSRLTVHISMRSAASEKPPPHPGLASRRIEEDLPRIVESIRRALDEVHAAKIQ